MLSKMVGWTWLDGGERLLYLARPFRMYVYYVFVLDQQQTDGFGFPAFFMLIKRVIDMIIWYN